MQGTALLASFPGSATTQRPAPAAPVASVFLPKEHGSWSLALEPLALGLLVAPSSAGGALTVAALAGFFARRPFKALSAPSASRRQEARETVVMFSALAVAGLFVVLVLGGITSLWPLLLAAPLGGLFAWFDAQNGSRAAAAEVAGSAAFALVPAALATLAGWSTGPALALAGLALTRSVPTVLTVRSSLRHAKGENAGFLLPVLTTVAATLGIILLCVLRLLPVWTALPPGCCSCAHSGSPARSARPGPRGRSASSRPCSVSSISPPLPLPGGADPCRNPPRHTSRFQLTYETEPHE